MMKLGLGALMVGVAFTAGCALEDDVDGDEAAVSGDEAELRRLKPGELAGNIACGETKRIRHPGTQTYRALAIAAKRGQHLDLEVSAPGHDPLAWVTTGSNATRAFNDDAHENTKDARVIYTAKSTGKHHVVFRERSYAKDVDFDVTLRCPASLEPEPEPEPVYDDPFDPASCEGPRLTHAEAVALIGAGNAQKIVAPAQKLRERKRSCNAVTGCGPWGAPKDATMSFYMARGSDNYNVARPFDVHLAFGVRGTTIEAVVEDVTNYNHCPGCTPSGVTYRLADGTIRDHYGNAALFIRYPRWTHGSGGFRITQEWASVPLGPKAQTTMHVASGCARVSVLSKDDQTEYAALFRY
jgi:hypothetical protein